MLAGGVLGAAAKVDTTFGNTNTSRSALIVFSAYHDLILSVLGLPLSLVELRARVLQEPALLVDNFLTVAHTWTLSYRSMKDMARLSCVPEPAERR